MAKPIKIEIIGDAKKFNATLEQTSSKLSSFGKVAVGAFAGLVAASAGAVGGLAALGGTFDEAFDTIRVGTGATGEALVSLQEDFKAVATSVPTSFGDAASAVADLNTRLGLTGEPLQALSGQFIELSRITGTDVAGNVDRLTRVFGDWGVAAEDQAGVLDQIFRSSQNSGIGIDELASSLVQFGAPLRNVGFNLAESQALLAVFNKTGVNTETVIAGLKAGVGKLAKAGEDVPSTFKRVVKEIQNAETSSIATAKAIELFGQRSGPDLADAIQGGKFSLDDMLAAIEGGSETIQAAADDTASWGERWQMIRNRVLVGLEPLATGVFNGISRAMDRATPVIDEIAGGIRAFSLAWQAADGDVTSSGFPGFMERLANLLRLRLVPAVGELASWFGRLSEEHGPKVVSALSQVDDVAANVWGGLKRLYGFLSDNDEILIGLGVAIGVGLVGAFSAWAVAATSAAVATLAAIAPVVAIGAAIAALTAGVVWAYRNWDWFRSSADAAGRFMRDTLWPALKSFGSWIAGTLVPTIGSVAVKLGGWIATAWNVAGDVASAIGGIPGKISDMASSVKRAASSLYDAITDPFRRALDWITDKWNGLKDLLRKGISIPNPLAGIPGADRLFGGARAYGGPVGTAGIYDVGEVGRERVFLPKGAYVQPAHQMAASGASVTINATTNARPADIASELAWALRTSGR